MLRMNVDHAWLWFFFFFGSISPKIEDPDVQGGLERESGGRASGSTDNGQTLISINRFCSLFRPNLDLFLHFLFFSLFKLK